MASGGKSSARPRQKTRGERIYALVREISRLVAFTTGAGSFTGIEGEEKRRPRVGTLGGGGGPASPHAARLLKSSGCFHLP